MRTDREAAAPAALLWVGVLLAACSSDPGTVPLRPVTIEDAGRADARPRNDASAMGDAASGMDAANPADATSPSLDGGEPIPPEDGGMAQADAATGSDAGADAAVPSDAG